MGKSQKKIVYKPVNPWDKMADALSDIKDAKVNEESMKGCGGNGGPAEMMETDPPKDSEYIAISKKTLSRGSNKSGKTKKGKASSLRGQARAEKLEAKVSKAVQRHGAKKLSKILWD